MIGNILRQRYRIIKKLGAGGFGETYLAEDLDIPVSPKPVCVVKKLHPTMIDPEIIRLFEQEAQILYKLGQNHDQIPKLSGYFQQDQEFYLIQEFIDGYDLSQEISPGKKLSEGDVIQLLRDVLEILVYVHKNKVIHRDIKPANIMRRKDGKLVLIDFGVVKQINTTIAIKSGSTSRTSGFGTVGYMPIEQAIGKPKLSSDIYALGMIAIQALIDLSPRLLAEDDDGEIIWIDQVEISERLKQFINKMVCCEWRQRYRNAKEALDELNKIFVINQRLLVVPKLVPVRLNGKYGYVSGGKLVIPCQFGLANNFSEGLASVIKGAKWGFINTIGELAIPYQFDNAWLFSEGLAQVKTGEKWGFINTIGELAIPYQFDDADNFSEGLAKVKIAEKWGFINTNGQLIIPCQFDDADNFSEGLAKVKIAEKWGFINTNGQLVIPCQFDNAWLFSEGLAQVKTGEKWGFINTNGQLVIPCQFDDADNFSEGLAKVKIGGKYGYMNTNSQVIIPCQFDNAFRFSEELAMVQIGEKYGYINTNGQIVIPCEFNQIYWFSEGLAAVQIGEKYGYINTNGEIFISCQFDRTLWFSEGLATVRIGDKCGYINTNGQIVIPYQFDNAYDFSEGLAKVTISGKDYLIDKTGKIVY
ncbi:WG repeat-containing protein [Dolichospermum lemmermannii CS-548]|uniref:WG repeat-containing protein n=1 Tax=Dolichospermum lemmermannii TaxID=54295 RepID=UPI00232E70DE|nr:WG repeat-containing protein [Dolichospermum lemmermannii]MDB9436214.1 WG repeat-containing protein [Dolichospermum lemmermannii CS-548]